MNELEKRYDKQFFLVFKAIQALEEQKARPRKKLGFEIPESK
jgi:hypothetical protein